MPASTSYLLTHGGYRVEVTYKNIRNLRLRVLAGGRVVVSVPVGVPERELRRFLDENHAWILQAQQRMRMATPPPEQLTDGGRVQLWGQWREVVVADGARGSAREVGGRIVVTGADEEARARGVEALYRRELQARLPELRDVWEERVGRRAAGLRFRRMTSRWGSCNTRTAMITLNTALAKRDPAALEYVLVHELVHLHERGHGPRFTAWMDALLPDWRARRAAMRGTP